jgi:hypothetical protein
MKEQERPTHEIYVRPASSSFEAVRWKPILIKFLGLEDGLYVVFVMFLL